MWNLEKIAALAPDTSTEKRGRGLANGKDWSDLGINGGYIWGLCKGSGTNPYKSQIDILAPAFSCTCPVFKPPCKHVLGLFFLWVQQPHLFAQVADNQLPDWVQTWVEKRRQKAVQKNTEKTPAELQKTAADKQKRWQKRLDLMQSGIDELQLWLLDMARQGFANMEVLNTAFWASIAARMNDAQMPRIGSLLKETPILLAQSPDWTGVLTRRLGELFVVVKMFNKRNDLSEAQQDNLLEIVGVPAKKAEVLAENPSILADWLVVGQKMETDIENREFRQVWLRQINGDNTAMLLDFLGFAQPYEQLFTVNSLLNGEMTFYPSLIPLRALFNNIQAQNTNWQLIDLNPLSNLSVLRQVFAQAVAKKIILSPLPALLAGVKVVWAKSNPFISDSEENLIPIHEKYQQTVYKLLAMSWGGFIPLFGLFDGYSFEPISCVWQGKIIPLQEQIIHFRQKTKL